MSVCILAAVFCRLLARNAAGDALLIRSTSTRLTLPKPIRQQGSVAHFPAPFPFHHIHPDFSIVGSIQTLSAFPPLLFLFFSPNQYNFQSKIWLSIEVKQTKYMESLSINPNIKGNKCMALIGIIPLSAAEKETQLNRNCIECPINSIKPFS